MDLQFWNEKRVLITGGSGFVGRWVGRTLHPANPELHILDIAPPKNYDVPHEYHRTDLRSLQAIVALLEQVNPAVVIHLAGQPGVKSSHENPLDAYEANVLGTFNMLEACRMQKRIDSLVAVSSNHVYGEQHQMPTLEDAPLNGSNTYAVSKVCGDVLARAYGKTYGVPVGIARMTNSFGPDDHHTSHIITATILACLSGKSPVINQSGKDRKGYLYIKDTADGLLAIASKVARNRELYGEAFNLAPNEAITVLDLVNTVMSATNLSGQPIIQSPTAVYEEEHLDNNKARDVLEWKPQYDIFRALGETIDWYRSRGI